MNKIIYGVAGVILLVAAFFVGKSLGTIDHSVGAVVNGSTNSTASIAEQSISAVSTTTVFSILNSDDNARVIESVSGLYSGGAASTTIYSITCATSSIASGYSQTSGSVNYILNTVLNSTSGATSSLIYLPASTSPGITNAASTGNGLLATTTRLWAPASYLVCETTTSAGSNSNLLDAGYAGFLRFGVSRQ